jgi:hypothetical protein
MITKNDKRQEPHQKKQHLVKVKANVISISSNKPAKRKAASLGIKPIIR